MSISHVSAFYFFHNKFRKFNILLKIFIIKPYNFIVSFIHISRLITEFHNVRKFPVFPSCSPVLPYYFPSCQTFLWKNFNFINLPIKICFNYSVPAFSYGLLLQKVNFSLYTFIKSFRHYFLIYVLPWLFIQYSVYFVNF